eukprot:3572002-Amphidinium_carterae.1
MWATQQEQFKCICSSKKRCHRPLLAVHALVAGAQTLQVSDVVSSVCVCITDAGVPTGFTETSFNSRANSVNLRVGSTPALWWGMSRLSAAWAGHGERPASTVRDPWHRDSHREQQGS